MKAVSYTHLDVYKRQVYNYQWKLSCFMCKKFVFDFVNHFLDKFFSLMAAAEIIRIYLKTLNKHFRLPSEFIVS